jgi:ActR/RegA family two-component response regulator
MCIRQIPLFLSAFRLMHRTVVIDSNLDLLKRSACLFRAAEFDVATAETGQSGIAVAAAHEPHALIVNLKLPDISGVDVAHAVRLARPTSCIVVTGVHRCHDAVRAMRGGADYCIEKAADSKLLLRIIKPMLFQSPDVRCDFDSVVAHSLKRWADVLVSSIESPTDLRTLEEWGRFVGVSVGGLRNWCRTASLPARRSLLLARVLRAVIMQQRTTLPPDGLLNIVDRRTLGKLLAQSGGTDGQLPTSLEEFLERQRLIEQPKAIAVLRATLSRRPA